MAASTGIVGATVVTMSLMALPAMLKAGYDARLATGTISATGTLGQIIPPSIALVLLGDVLSNAYQQAQVNQGIFRTQVRLCWRPLRWSYCPRALPGDSLLDICVYQHPAFEK